VVKIQIQLATILNTTLLFEF